MIGSTVEAEPLAAASTARSVDVAPSTQSVDAMASTRSVDKGDIKPRKQFCAACGKSFVNLGGHVRATHGKFGAN